MLYREQVFWVMFRMRAIVRIPRGTIDMYLDQFRKDIDAKKPRTSDDMRGVPGSKAYANLLSIINRWSRKTKSGDVKAPPIAAEANRKMAFSFLSCESPTRRITHVIVPFCDAICLCLLGAGA